MILFKKLVLSSLIFLTLQSCNINDSNSELVQDLSKEIVGHWEFEDQSFRFTENGTFQDSIFWEKEDLFFNNTCEVNEDESRVPIQVVSGNYTINNSIVEFSSLTLSLGCNPQPTVNRMFPYYDKVISISNDSLTFQSTRTYLRNNDSGDNILGSWKTVNPGLIHHFENPNGLELHDISEELTITQNFYTTKLSNTFLPNDTLEIESRYYYSPPTFINVCCSYPITYHVEIDGNEMRWTGPENFKSFIYSKSEH